MSLLHLGSREQNTVLKYVSMAYENASHMLLQNLNNALDARRIKRSVIFTLRNGKVDGLRTNLNANNARTSFLLIGGRGTRIVKERLLKNALVELALKLLLPTEEILRNALVVKRRRLNSYRLIILRMTEQNIGVKIT